MSDEFTEAISDPQVRAKYAELHNEYQKHRDQVLREKFLQQKDNPKQIADIIIDILDTERRCIFKAISEVFCRMNEDDAVLHIEEDGTMY